MSSETETLSGILLGLSTGRQPTKIKIFTQKAHMYTEPHKLKIAACLVGGLLLYVSGCSLSSPDQADSPEVQTQLQPKVQLAATVSINVVTSPTPTLTTAPPTATPTPSVEAMPIPRPEYGPFAQHTISAGETLGYIAFLYQTEIDELVQMNNLEGPSTIIQVDQVLRVPVQTDIRSPKQMLLPDSEVVYGPAYVDFDLATFIQEQNGYLANHQEKLQREASKWG